VCAVARKTVVMSEALRDVLGGATSLGRGVAHEGAMRDHEATERIRHDGFGKRRVRGSEHGDQIVVSGKT